MIVGANGAGKSALGLWLQQNSGGSVVRRLIAHRQLWFSEDGPSITAADRQTQGQRMVSWSGMPDSRWQDHASSQRAPVLLFDLLAGMNSENRKMVDLASSGIPFPEVEAMTGPRLLTRLNSVLKSAALPIQIRATDQQTFNAVNMTRGAEYPIFKMSDGEKSAVLLAVDILTAPANCIQIIDEPERHLHRSISSGLIEAVMSDRTDCHFVVLTHDLELAGTVGKERGTALVLTDCVWAGDTVSAWDLFEVGLSDAVPENAQRAILGGRKDVLFIEGDSASLDIRLYGLLFPQWTLSPSGGANSVIRAVTGLTASEDHHWVRARGVVDGDGRSEAERLSLAERGILSLPVSEVENVYYLDLVVEEMARVQATALGKSSATLLQDARSRVLSALRTPGTLERLAGKLALAEVQRRIVDGLPHELDGSTDTIAVSFQSPYPKILGEIEQFLREGKVDSLMRAVPIRDTAVRTQIASALGYQKLADYESAVRVRITDSDALRTAVQASVGTIPMAG